MCATSHAGQRHQCHHRLQLLILQGMYVLWSQAAWVEMYEDALINLNASLNSQQDPTAQCDIKGNIKQAKDFVATCNRNNEDKCRSTKSVWQNFLFQTDPPWSWRLMRDEEAKTMKDKIINSAKDQFESTFPYLASLLSVAYCDQRLMVAYQKDIHEILFWHRKHEEHGHKIEWASKDKVDNINKKRPAEFYTTMHERFHRLQESLRYGKADVHAKDLIVYQDLVKDFYDKAMMLLSDDKRARYSPSAMWKDVSTGMLYSVYKGVAKMFASSEASSFRILLTTNMDTLCSTFTGPLSKTMTIFVLGGTLSTTLGGFVGAVIFGLTYGGVCAVVALLKALGVVVANSDLQEKALVSLMTELLFFEHVILLPDLKGEAENFIEGMKKAKDMKVAHHDDSEEQKKKKEQEKQQPKQNLQLVQGCEGLPIMCEPDEICMRWGIFVCLEKNKDLTVNRDCRPKCVKAAIPDTGNVNSPSLCSWDNDCRSGICEKNSMDNFLGKCVYVQSPNWERLDAEEAAEEQKDGKIKIGKKQDGQTEIGEGDDQIEDLGVGP